MIDSTQIRTLAAQAKTDPGILEKDYVLSKALMALAEIPEFQACLAFKGGTALKKCYYPNWRFSEDLDFTALRSLKPSEVTHLFQKGVENAVRQSGLALKIIEYSQYPRKGPTLASAQLKLGYDGPLRKASGQKNNIRVDIAFNEKVISPPLTKSISKLYGDDVDMQLLVYALEEIVAEKLRSILQRGKSRDYHDIWMLLKNKQKDFSLDKAWQIFEGKCRHKAIPLPKVDDFFVPERTQETARYWERGLAHQTADLPAFSEVLDELRDLLEQLSPFT